MHFTVASMEKSIHLKKSRFNFLFQQNFQKFELLKKFKFLFHPCVQIRG